jgi:hypothetical protein
MGYWDDTPIDDLFPIKKESGNRLDIPIVTDQTPARAPKMQFFHRDFQFELNNSWWTEARMRGFQPTSRSYLIDDQQFPNCFEIAIEDIAPVRRELKYGVFNDCPKTGLPAKDRVMRILGAFLSNSPLPPVEVVTVPGGYPSKFKLTDGAHRLYLSIAAGFTHVPAVEGFDINWR